MRQQTPTEALTEWLGRKIAAAAPGTWLPADRELARRFGLSSRTVARIMGGLAAEGKLVRVQGKGTSIPGGAPQVEMECGPMRTSAEALAEQITEALVHGEMKQGEALPSVKFMARRFKVSAVQTLGRVLAGLLALDLISLVSSTV